MINLILISVIIIFFIISIYIGILPTAEYDRNTVDNITNNLAISAANKALLNSSREYLNPQESQLLINNEIISETANINENIQNAKTESIMPDNQIRDILSTKEFIEPTISRQGPIRSVITDRESIIQQDRADALLPSARQEPVVIDTPRDDNQTER